MKKIFLLFFLMFGVAYSSNNIEFLKEYIEIGKNNNLQLQSAKYTLQSYDLKVNQAVANFLPTLDINARYTRAGGGRSFDFPIGDMMNPIYEFIGSPIRFQNVTESFIRPHEQETKLEITQPLSLAIYNNYLAQGKLKEAAEFEYKVKELDLIYNIIDAYYNYVKASHLVEIRKTALTLIKEGYNVSEKLFEAEKVPKSDVLRSEVSLRTGEQDLKSAENQMNLAKNYFNSLLSRDLNSEIYFVSEPYSNLMMPESMEELKFKFSIQDATTDALNLRPDLKQYGTTIETLDYSKSAITSDFLPSVAIVFDYGIQGEEYTWDNESRYWMLNFVLKWNLFSGFSTSAKAEEMELQISSLKKSVESIKSYIALDVKNNFDNYTNVYQQLDVAKKSLESAEENYSLNQKRYKEGFNTYINLLDAETTLILSKENFIITYFDILQAKSRLEKSIGIDRIR